MGLSGRAAAALLVVLAATGSARAADTCSGLDSTACGAADLSKTCYYKDGKCNSYDAGSKDGSSGSKDSTSGKDANGGSASTADFELASLGSRQYVAQLPASGTAATGLIIILFPMGAVYAAESCAAASEGVAAATGAAVVCPVAADVQSTTGKGGAGGTSACWRTFDNFPYCGDAAGAAEDVAFIKELISSLSTAHSIPAGRVIVAGFSNGGSMAFRFGCDHAADIAAVVVVGQAFRDPVVGFYDYANNVVPTGEPQCAPSPAPAYYGVIGEDDVYYGRQPSAAGLGAMANWEDSYSTKVLGCAGDRTATDVPEGVTSSATCYRPATCPGNLTNVMCEVPGMDHDSSPMSALVTVAFGDLFGLVDNSGATTHAPLAAVALVAAAAALLCH